MDLRKLSDRALDERIERLRAKWSAAYDRARIKPGYRDLRPSDRRALAAGDPIHDIYAEMLAIDADTFTATDHRAARSASTHGVGLGPKAGRLMLNWRRPCGVAY